MNQFKSLDLKYTRFANYCFTTKYNKLMIKYTVGSLGFSPEVALQFFVEFEPRLVRPSIRGWLLIRDFDLPSTHEDIVVCTCPWGQ